MRLDTVEGFQRFGLGQLLGLQHEVDTLAERGADLFEQRLIVVGLEQHRLWQATHHHPFTQGDGEIVVVVDVRVGLQEGLRIGIGLGGFVSDPGDLFLGHAARADECEQFGERVFHGGWSCLKERKDNQGAPKSVSVQARLSGLARQSSREKTFMNRPIGHAEMHRKD